MCGNEAFAFVSTVFDVRASAKEGSIECVQFPNAQTVNSIVGIIPLAIFIDFGIKRQEALSLLSTRKTRHVFTFL